MSNYAKQKLNRTIRILATGRGRIRDRLVKAFTSEFHVLQAEHFPKELRTEIEEIRGLLTRVEAETSEEGRVHASVRDLTEDEAVTVARRIVELAAQLEE